MTVLTSAQFAFAYSWRIRRGGGADEIPCGDLAMLGKRSNRSFVWSILNTREQARICFFEERFLLRFLLYSYTHQIH